MAWMAIIRSSAKMSTITSRRFPAEPGADYENLRRIGVGIEIDRDHLVRQCVQDVVVADAVLAGRPMDLHHWSS